MDQEQRTDGADTLCAQVYGDSIPALKLAALDKARELYGPDAELRIEGTGAINTSSLGEGKFWAYVTVRCLNLLEEDR